MLRTRSRLLSKSRFRISGRLLNKPPHPAWHPRRNVSKRPLSCHTRNDRQVPASGSFGFSQTFNAAPAPDQD